LPKKRPRRKAKVPKKPPGWMERLREQNPYIMAALGSKPASTDLIKAVEQHERKGRLEYVGISLEPPKTLEEAQKRLRDMIEKLEDMETQSLEQRIESREDSKN